ncbi:unnamed protein product [Linum tenue]|uniref:Uncharacterized protein n=1 Tax=Linum tenue TaxID=586396 RepID=A0AAV0HQS9_9ROSI|nr:unnamed protein product [Linum tenue]
MKPKIAGSDVYKSAGVEIGELVDRFRQGIGVLEHPEQVLEQDDLAPHAYVVAAAAVGALRQLPEQRVVHNVGAQEVPPPRFPDVDWPQVPGAADGVGGGGGVGVGVVGGGSGGDRAPASAELGVEGVELLEDRLEFGELAAAAASGHFERILGELVA